VTTWNVALWGDVLREEEDELKRDEYSRDDSIVGCVVLS
jgi:hypothetical protein